MSAATFYLKLAIAVSGIYVCYLAYGVFQEQLYREQEDGTKFNATAFVLGAQCLVNTLIAAIGEILVRTFAGVDKSQEGRAPFLSLLPKAQVLQTSTVYVLAMYTSNEALAFVAYPTQALVKSCKMIPVLLGSVIINGKRYSLLKYLCVLMMSAGIAIFQFGGKAKKSHGSDDVAPTQWIGMLLLVVSLALDGIANPLQDNLKDLKLSNTEQMLANNVWATVLMGFIALGLGQFGSSLAYIAAHPGMTQALIMFSLTSAFGQLFIFWTIRTFGSLTNSAITTTRKFFTIVASVFFYGHPISNQQWFAVAVVFAALMIETFVKDGKAKHGVRAQGSKEHDK